MSMVSGLAFPVGDDGVFAFRTQISDKIGYTVGYREALVKAGPKKWPITVTGEDGIKYHATAEYDGNKDGFIDVVGNVNDKPEHLN